MNLLSHILFIILCTVGVAEASSRHQFTITTRGGPILIESFGGCAKARCPAVVILSGSRGFAAPAYDEIGGRFQAAGLSAYLVHVLSKDDLDAIRMAGSVQTRLAYYARRMPDWTSSVLSVVTQLREQPRHGGKLGVMGISLGAQIASAASAGRSDIDALVLVDGGFPSGYSQSVHSFPPLHLIWGSADRTFPLSIGRALHLKAQQLGGYATLDVYDGETHDFFLKSDGRNVAAAHRSAADFLTVYLLR